MLNSRSSCFLLLALLTPARFLALRPGLVSGNLGKPTQSNGSAPKVTQPAAGLEMLTDTEGVDFNSYLGTVYRSVRDKWNEGMPPSVKLGQQGKNVVQFRIMQDGKIPEDFLKLVH